MDLLHLRRLEADRRGQGPPGQPHESQLRPPRPKDQHRQPRHRRNRVRLRPGLQPHQQGLANLKAQNQALTYNYDFNRLTAVTFPANPRLNIRYSYGAPGAPNNTAGRLTQVVSHTTATTQGNLEDSQERQYGKLGEVVYEKQTVVTYTSPLNPSVFETRYHFDPFGRLQRLTYPDGEVLTNVYDSGGNLQSTPSEKNGLPLPLPPRPPLRQVRTARPDGAGQRRQDRLQPTTPKPDASTPSPPARARCSRTSSYGYDKVGNVLTLANQVPVRNRTSTAARPARPSPTTSSTG